MSDSTPTKKLDTINGDAKSSRTLMYVLIGIGALLLIAVIVLIATLLAGNAKPAAVVTQTPTPSATPTTTPIEPSATPSASPSESETEEPAPPPAPAPDPVPGFDSFNYQKDAGCQPGDSQKQLTFSWSSDDAVRAWVGVQTKNAKSAPYSGQLPPVYTYTDLYYNCDQASQYYTVTIEDASGHLTHKTVTIKP